MGSFLSFYFYFSLSFFLSQLKIDSRPDSENSYFFLVSSLGCRWGCYWIVWVFWTSSKKSTYSFLYCYLYWACNFSISKKSNYFLGFFRLFFQSWPNRSNKNCTASLTQSSGLESLCLLNRKTVTLWPFWALCLHPQMQNKVLLCVPWERYRPLEPRWKTRGSKVPERCISRGLYCRC